MSWPRRRTGTACRVAKVTFTLHDNDKKLIAFARKTTEDVMWAAGAEEVVQEARYAHLVGAARMGSDPRSSVVDGFGQSHDIPNLFICDGSILPTQGSANPGLTIQALAARTADYLIGERENVLAGEAPGLGVAPPIRHDLSPRGTSGRGVPRLKGQCQMSSAPTVSIWRQRVHDLALELRARRRDATPQLGVDTIEVCEFKLDEQRAAEQLALVATHGLAISSVQPVGAHPVPQPVAARAERRAGAHGPFPPDDRTRCPVSARTLPSSPIRASRRMAISRQLWTWRRRSTAPLADFARDRGAHRPGAAQRRDYERGVGDLDVGAGHAYRRGGRP